MKIFSLCLSFFLVTALFISLGSCKKETNCIASVQCVDMAGNNVDNATVMLYALVISNDGKKVDTADVRTSGVTDSDGMVKFTFKLPATYDINAIKYIGGQKYNKLGVIKLEEGKTVTKTVTMPF
jgi:hypothetical protein